MCDRRVADIMKKPCKTALAIAAMLVLTACSTTTVFSEPSSLTESGENAVAGDAGTIDSILTQLHIDSSEEVLAARTNKAPADEVRAVWIAYLDLAPVLKGKTEAQFKESIGKMYDNCVSIGLNTVIVQVRPFSDSFYPSELFPWSSYCSGTLGKALSYDPMKIMVSEAESRKLKIEAWVNPMRAMTTAEIKNVSSDFPIRQWYDDSSLKSQNLIEYDGRLYYNPASAEARKLIADGAAEIVKNYGVDGVHIDDYFYPPSLPNSYDKAQYDAYVKAGGKLSQADWRRDNTSKMVKEMNEAIKKADSSALFGISPRGVISQNVDQLYIDVEEWCSTPGYCDYIAPQLYYGFKHSTAAYDAVMKQWSDLVTCDDVTLLVGLAAYKVGQTDQYGGSGQDEWRTDHDILAHQIDDSRAYKNYGGMIFFRYEQIFSPASNAKEAMELEKQNFTALLK